MTKYKLCLSTIVEATGPQQKDEVAVQRLQDAFTADDGHRFALHAEAIAYHLQQLVAWALSKNNVRRPSVGIDASDNLATRTIQVDCFLKAGEVKDASST